MIQFLAKRWIPNHTEYHRTEVRSAYGILCSIVGIFINVLLCISKFIAGSLSGSIAITADALNNLSDAASSIITMLGFVFAGKKADSEHPFGHGRMEYLAGLGVSVLILWMGFDLGKNSVLKLIHPQEISGGWLISSILLLSVLLKSYMYFYNKSIGKKIDSAAMNATAADSFSDAVSTSVVLLCTIISTYTGLHLDGACGIFVSLLIIKTGFDSAKDTISPLLGEPPTEELVQKIEQMVLSSDLIVGMHDLVVHDYGPGRLMISLHAEIPGNRNIYEIHDEIDNMECKLSQEFSCEAVIHMDPIAVDDVLVMEMKQVVLNIVKEIDPVLTIHDFRMVKGTTHTNLIFDVVVPFSFSKSDAEVKQLIQEQVSQKLENCNAVIKVDKS